MYHFNVKWNNVRVVLRMKTYLMDHCYFVIQQIKKRFPLQYVNITLHFLHLEGWVGGGD